MSRYAGEDRRRAVIRFLCKYLVIAALIFAGNSFLVTVHVVHGEDMYPRLRDGDLLLVLRGKRAGSTGDVIVYEKDGERYAGRIAAGPVDTISFSKEGDLLVNGSPAWEDVFYPTCAVEGQDTDAFILEEGTWYVLADRRTEGTDSRTLGPVTQEEIVGKVFWVLRHRGI